MQQRSAQQTRKFHQAKWDEEIIFELHTPGERGIIVPAVEDEIATDVGDVISSLPAALRRKQPPALPEVGQMRVLKHFLRLSQQTLGADFNVDVGQGTCTVKYNPKINKYLAASPKVTELHPWQDDSTVQGALEIIYRLDQYFQKISGLDYFSFQPPSGSAAIFTMAAIVEKYHRTRGEQDQRDEIITTIFSHPSDYSAVAVKGYKIITLHQNEDGLPDVEALKAAVSKRTAALFITNPEDTGIFNPHIKEFTAVVHGVGGLCCYDQANANGILGITRAREANFDMCFFNLHKTFSTPHGCGGPATGAIGVTSELRDYLPVPIVIKMGDGYKLDYDLLNTIGKVRSFLGVFPVILKAYAWVRSMGARGLLETARVAVLNNNYLMAKIKQIRGAAAPYAEGRHRIEQVRYSWEKLTDDTGVGTEDVTGRMADFGFHLWSSHHPFVVPEPFTIEPTESYSKLEMDEYVAGLKQVVQESYSDPEMVTTAPHNSVIHKIDHSTLDDPDKWAITWRSFLKKRPGEQLNSVKK
ncbi:MAG: aminomethyl-transferring glycine dehydrogenase subunit GcvPB [Candidatus Marinimicrobia bacterium]|nr:aminomethyl-transferring glycine dehydrogenase subunit GcvPB [Candidatus Neomarinimicrobiota bacterium]